MASGCRGYVWLSEKTVPFNFKDHMTTRCTNMDHHICYFFYQDQ